MNFGMMDSIHGVHDLKFYRKERDLQMKKMVLLSEFEVPEKEQSKFRGHSPTTDAMRSSLENIGNMFSNDPKEMHKKPSDKFAFFDHSASKFLLSNGALINSTKLTGRKPCARDGHSATIIDNRLIIFGGDRHKMCFNDLYALNLQHLEELRK